MKIKYTLPFVIFLELRKKLGFIDPIHPNKFNYKLLKEKRKLDAGIDIRKDKIG